MSAPSDGDPLRADLRRRFDAWRAALLGVTSATVASAQPVQRPVQRPRTAPLQTPAGQAAFDLSRPRATFAQPFIVGAFIAIYAAMIAAPISLVAAPVSFVVVMLGTLWLALRRREKQLREVSGRVLNSAFNLIGLGRLRDASEVLDQVEAKATAPWTRRLVGIQRAIIAIRRGDMAPAEAHLTFAIEQPIQGFARENALYQLEGAHAMRAFVRASLGKHEAAREDIAAVKSGPASDDALARVALAEALILEQQGKREELRLLLAEKSTLLLEHTHPRERVIVRAFQRMVRADKGSVYRRAEPRREQAEGEEPTLADWVSKVAPGAASFVRSARPAEQVAKVAPQEVLQAPTDAAVRAVAAAKKPVKKGSAMWAILGVVASIVLVAAVVALRDVLTMPEVGTGAVAAAGSTSWITSAPFLSIPLLGVPLAYVVAGITRWVGRRRAERDARHPRGGPGSGAPSDAQLQQLTGSPSPVVAAQAWLLIADRAERNADFAGALQAATTGLSRLSSPRDRAAADIVYPDLVSLRAFALAACGRLDESNAELATLGPAYPHYSRAVFRARLLALVRSPDLRWAMQWIDQGEADLPLSVREELLVDLVRASVHPEQSGAGEVQRLKDELATTPHAKDWIRAVAPHLLEAFDHATMADVRMRIDAGGDADHQAEEEAAAALEAAGAEPRLAH
jgi:hypothetical protein